MLWLCLDPFPLHAAVLKPDLHLSLGQLEGHCNLVPPQPSQVVGVQKLRLQLLYLLLCERGPLLPAASTGAVAAAACIVAHFLATTAISTARAATPWTAISRVIVLGAVGAERFPPAVVASSWKATKVPINNQPLAAQVNFSVPYSGALRHCRPPTSRGEEQSQQSANKRHANGGGERPDRVLS